jgi:aldehyde dehydrogenase (NAD+)
MRALAQEMEVAEIKAATPDCAGVCRIAAARTIKPTEAAWADWTVKERLRVLRAARHAMAGNADAFAAAISSKLARSKADTMVSELLTLLDACRFLEREASRLLAPRKLGLSGRPVWFFGVHAEVLREPLGHVLVIGPSNFPLFLAGVQVLQALVAGNTVTWKPGAGGAGVAKLMAQSLYEAGLPADALTVTDESVEAAKTALAAGPDKVIFTGSAENGRRVLATLAETATPAVVELSGADAILVMPSADLKRVAKAVAFGLRLNGAAVCMSPRRLIASAQSIATLLPLLQAELVKVPPVALDAATTAKLQDLLFEAMSAGATLHGEFTPESQGPLVVAGAQAKMGIANSDIFAPVISLIAAESMLHGLEQYAQCRFALGVSIFCGRGDEKRARAMATMLKAGTVLINDVIAPTADPRVSFGGRGASGYGVTRGAEGLLEMTALKTVLVKRGSSTLHMDPLQDADAPMLAGAIAAIHGKGFARRWAGLLRMIRSVRR